MLYSIFVWTFLLLVCLTIGLGVLNTIQTNTLRQSDRLIVAIWLGVVFLATTLLFVSLQSPVSTPIGLTVMVGLCALSLLSRAVRTELATFRAKLTPKTLLLYGLIALLAAALTTKPVVWTDAGLYHYQLIQWLHQFGTVPGLALLFANFGFTSSWFALAAPFNPGELASRGNAVLGGFVVLLAGLQIWVGISAGLGAGIGAGVSERARLSDWFLCIYSSLLLLGSFGSQHLYEIVVSPSPDVPVGFLTGIVAWTILLSSPNSSQSSTSEHPLQHIEESSNPNSPLNPTFLPLVLSLGAVTIKLVALPLLFVGGFFYTLYNRPRLGHLLRGWVAVALLFCPFLVAQLQTSGCPLFPSAALCLNTASTVTPKVQQSIAKLTHDWRSWYQVGEAMTLSEAIWSWFKSYWGNQLMVLLALVSVVFLLRLLRQRHRDKHQAGSQSQSQSQNQSHNQPNRHNHHSQTGAIVWLIAMQAVGVLFYLKTSPLLRFALPWLILIPALFAALYCIQQNLAIANFCKKIRLSQLRSVPVIAFTTVLVISVVIGSGQAFRLILPPALRSVAVVAVWLNDFAYWSPQNDELCWNTPLPCAFKVTNDVHLRDPAGGIATGFTRN